MSIELPSNTSLNQLADAIANDIGDLSKLTTEEQLNLVDAINELHIKIRNLENEINQ